MSVFPPQSVVVDTSGKSEDTWVFVVRMRWWWTWWASRFGGGEREGRRGQARGVRVKVGPSERFRREGGPLVSLLSH